MNNLVVKHNALTNASYNLDLVEQRLILLAIVDARRSGQGVTANNPLTITASDYAQQFNTTRQAAYWALKNACENLFNRYFKYAEGSKNIKSRWVSQIAYIDAAAQVELIFSPAIVPLITELERHFTQYAIEQIAGLNSAYAVRLYELLISWRGTQNTGLIKLAELRNRLGVEPDEYQKMSDFKRRVLDLAISQINEHTDITASYEQHKAGRVIIGFSFTFKLKKPEKIEKKKAATEKPKDSDTEKREALSQFVGYQQRAKLLNEPIEKLASKKELAQFRKFEFM